MKPQQVFSVADLWESQLLEELDACHRLAQLGADFRQVQHQWLTLLREARSSDGR